MHHRQNPLEYTESLVSTAGYFKALSGKHLDGSNRRQILSLHLSGGTEENNEKRIVRVVPTEIRI
jgi:hypothetical protein